MAPSKENLAKSRLATLKIKLSTYKDEELAEEAIVDNLRDDIARFKSGLQELEDAFCARIAGITDEVQINTHANEYSTLTRDYEKFVKDLEVKHKDKLHGPAVPAAAPQPTQAQKINVLVACINTVKTQARKDVDKVKTDLEKEEILTAAKRANYMLLIEAVKEEIEVKMFNHYKDIANLEPDRAVARMEAFTTDRNSILPEVMDLICKVNEKSIQTPGNLTNPQAQSTPNATLVHAAPQDPNLAHNQKAMQYM